MSLVVLGFAIGLVLWAPLSEIYCRRMFFVTTHACMVAFVDASAGAGFMPAVLVFRFMAGMFGELPPANSGGVIAECLRLQSEDWQ
ncbi:uncharacterized protein TRIREDRAFT_71817 [Trichoderma reesei QM6a]|jgi:MFS family permease|uniref:Predicted protein n=1 Tax=Hypocrea jecorina (strain QM6a) TaxID=431241 RepID=G0RNV7_HYPJQ|nr:uncharacterized protein TRIREDRAFT_71817 [Trichoderma reesei QM6a]EGR46918.1 predicted protein [Trichoderma reesei QM6a]